MPKLINNRPNKDVKVVCWIVTSDDLLPRKVLAEYDLSKSRWSYYVQSKAGKALSSWSGLCPYYPTFGYGNRSYYGDGPKYVRKKDALKESVRLRKREIQLAIKKRLVEIKTLRSNLKTLNEM